uniref:NELL (neural EGFL like) family member 3 n=1 Tax=Oryzias latipes TaxID=8090 RepID=A0A3B3H6Q1_ORYLA
PRPCTGAHCPGARSVRPPRQFSPSTRGKAAQAEGDQARSDQSSTRTQVESFPALHGGHGDGGARRRCGDADCAPATTQSFNETRQCRGIECRLPQSLRAKALGRFCVGDGCPAAPEEESVPRTAGQLPLVHVSDRAAQFLADFPDFGHSSPELGGASLGVQLTCDIKPENEVPSEDALILHLQLSKGQEKLVEALRAQQVIIRDLQQKLADQQEALLSQQRQILDQQRLMYEQMGAVKSQYGLLSDTFKQVSFQGLQDELQSYFESHLAGLQSQARSHLRKSYVIHKMDADSKVMDAVGEAHLPQPLLGCAGPCGSEEFCDFQRSPPQCEKCTLCPPGFFLISQCSPTADRLCQQDRDECLELPNICGERVKCLNTPTHIFSGLQLNIRGKERSDLLSNEAGLVTFLQHGLVWLDHNFAIKHNCRNFLQAGMRINGSQAEEGQDLSGIRIEQPDGKYFQGISVSTGVEVEPNQTLTLLLKSPSQHCNQSKDLHVFDVSAPSLSVLWLSHDTGAVAMTAQMSLLAHYQTSYRPTFSMTSVSDPYVISLTHDGRAVRFTESGVVKFVLQQALYSMGHTCVREGFSLIAYTSQNGTGQEVMRAFKTGVNYRDTSITLSGAVSVESRDTLSFEITSPSQCNIRYFGDSTGISMLSLIWIPSAVASALTATVSRTGLPSGAVRNKPLLFQQISPDTPQVHLAHTGQPGSQKNFIFQERGTANVALNLKLIHSCNIIKLTLHQTGGQQSGPVAQQVSGSKPEGSEWASVGLRASLQVQNGTALYVTLDCIRGRVNHISHKGGTNVSILWVAL